MKKELTEKIKRLQVQLASVSFTRASAEILTTSNNHAIRKQPNTKINNEPEVSENSEYEAKINRTILNVNLRS